MSAGTGSWIATVWSRPTRAGVPMHWVLGLVALLAAGLYTAPPMVLGPGTNVSLHDTYYVVAHVHSMLVVGTAFAFFAGWYYVFPKLTGGFYSEALGRLHFWLTFAGVCLILLPVPLSLALAPPQRFIDYSEEAFTYMSWLASAGSYLVAAGLVVFAAATLRAWLARGPHG